MIQEKTGFNTTLYRAQKNLLKTPKLLKNAKPSSHYHHVDERGKFDQIAHIEKNTYGFT